MMRMRWSFMMSAPHERALPPPAAPEFAFWGRSNVGKSSLLNALMDDPSLARVSKRPGCTQALNFYHCNHLLLLVDLPGLGYSKVQGSIKRQWGRLLPHYLCKRPNLVRTYMLIDSRHALQPMDHTALAFLKDHGCPFHIVLTKTDAIPASVLDQRIEALRAMRLHNPVFPVSSKKKRGLDALRVDITTSLI